MASGENPYRRQGNTPPATKAPTTSARGCVLPIVLLGIFAGLVAYLWSALTGDDDEAVSQVAPTMEVAVAIDASVTSPDGTALGATAEDVPEAGSSGDGMAVDADRDGSTNASVVDASVADAVDPLDAQRDMMVVLQPSAAMRAIELELHRAWSEFDEQVEGVETMRNRRMGAKRAEATIQAQADVAESFLMRLGELRSRGDRTSPSEDVVLRLCILVAQVKQMSLGDPDMVPTHTRMRGRIDELLPGLCPGTAGGR